MIRNSLLGLVALVSGACLVPAAGAAESVDETAIEKPAQALQAEIKPAVETVKAVVEAGEVCDAPHIDHIAEENVRRTIADIRAASPVLTALEEDGRIQIVGAMYDVATGEVTWL